VADSPPQVSSLASHPAAASAVTAHLAHAPAAPALSTALETGALANAGLHPMHALLALMQSPGKLVQLAGHMATQAGTGGATLSAASGSPVDLTHGPKQLQLQPAQAAGVALG